MLANYVYEKVGVSHKKVIDYKNVLPKDRVFGWSDIGHFHIGQYILIHSVIYRARFAETLPVRIAQTYILCR